MSCLSPLISTEAEAEHIGVLKDSLALYLYDRLVFHYMAISVQDLVSAESSNL